MRSIEIRRQNFCIMFLRVVVTLYILVTIHNVLGPEPFQAAWTIFALLPQKCWRQKIARDKSYRIASKYLTYIVHAWAVPTLQRPGPCISANFFLIFVNVPRPITFLRNSSPKIWEWIRTQREELYRSPKENFEKVLKKIFVLFCTFYLGNPKFFLHFLSMVHQNFLTL